MQDIIRKCEGTGKDFLITKQEQEFYKKNNLPLPTASPIIRKKFRDKWGMSPVMSIHKCMHCSQDSIIPYSTNMGRPVICRECWGEHKSDTLELEYIPGKFLEQFEEILVKTPLKGRALSHSSDSGENVTRSVETSFSKNIEDCFDTSKCTNLVNSFSGLIGVHDSIDCVQSDGSELCIGLIGSNNCYQCMYLEDCNKCKNVHYSDNTRNCSNCFGCSGLRDAQYNIFNEPYDKEEYEKQVKELLEMDHEEIVTLVEEKLKDVPVPALNNSWSGEDSDFTSRSWGNLNTYYAFYSPHNKYSGYLWQVEGGENLWEASVTRNITNGYQLSDCSYGSNLYFAWDAFECRNAHYLFGCYKAVDCLGCVGLSETQYTILNKEYSKDEYMKLKQQILDELRLEYDGA